MEREETLFRMFGKFYPEGTILFTESDLGEEMYYLLSGSLRVRRGASGGEETLTPGDILGEEALLQRTRRRSMAEVTADARLLVIDAGSLEKAARNGPELSASVLAGLMKKLDGAWEGLREWQFAYFLDRMETLLCGSNSSVPLTVTGVSEATGIEEEGVRRVLEGLVEAGAMAQAGESYRVADHGTLERVTRERRYPRAGGGEG